jgi:hypothetical protein
MKTRILLLLCIFLSIGLTKASAQNGTPYHSYPTKVNDAYGFLFVTCDGVNVDFIECQWDGMDILHLCKEGPSRLKDIAHWKFTSASTGEEFRVKESANADVTLDSEGNYLTGEATDRAILIGDKGSRYKFTAVYSWTPTSFNWEFVDIRCF